MNLDKIENELKNISSNINKETFAYDFLLSYGLPKSSINRLKKGDYNQSKINNEIIWAKKVYFKAISKGEDVHNVIDEISKSTVIEKQKIRFIIVTDFKTFLSKDVKINDTLDIQINKLNESLDFFLPLIGQEKYVPEKENEADIKAAYKMGKLYDIIIANNKDILKDAKERHGLNIFFTRILFCFFAEDANIFEKGLFTSSIKLYTNSENDNIQLFFQKLFETLNTENRNNLPNYLTKFPYVNGGLFKDRYKIPKLTKEFRTIMIECGDLDWVSINPDILGSMMQAIVHSGQRKELGMHYTSVKNIIKVINPLFLDQLNKDLEEAKYDIRKLKKILMNIYNLQFIDPACGSGNFLVIAYKEICKLEIEIYKRLKSLDENNWLILRSGISLSQFCGIEKDDYACETAKLSLWIAQHQMNLFFQEVLGEEKPTLPLSPSGNIYCDNAARVDWNLLFSKDTKKNQKIFIFGNPPYGGHEKRTNEQKKDFEFVQELSPKLDYISLWFYKASKFIINKDASVAFVTTKSICLGEQVEKIWPLLLDLKINIDFAYKPFWWKNNAKYNATVMCTVIGFSNQNNLPKYLYDENTVIKAKAISPYLMPGENIIVKKISKKPISNLPKILFGNMARDNGHLILSDKEKNDLLYRYPETKKFIRKLIGGKEFLSGHKRWCLWISDNLVSEANKITSIKNRLDLVAEFRNRSRNPTTKKFAKLSNKFVEIRHQEKQSLIIPITTSGNRKYIPMSFSEPDHIITNSMNMIYDAPLYLFSILQSKMHMLWVFTVSGYLGPSIRYSAELSYNTFPFPNISDDLKDKLEQKAVEVLFDEREKYPEKSLDQLYAPNKIPQSLLSKHQEIDDLVDNCYQDKSFKNDYERLNLLFQMYNDMTANKKLF